MSGGFADLYRSFEDRFRGGPDLIAERLSQYRPLLQAVSGETEARRAIDLGCGRGEWMGVLAEEGFEPIGVDLDDGMLEVARQAGLAAHKADALGFLRDEPDGSAAIVSAFHLVEHLPVDEVLAILREAHRVLVDGGLLILETPNPENLSVGAHTFHLDPTHRSPLPPPLLAFLAESSGFADHAILRTNGPTPPSDAGALERALSSVWSASPDYACLAQKRVALGDAAPRVVAPFVKGRSQPNPANLVAVMDEVRTADRVVADLAQRIETVPALAEQTKTLRTEFDRDRQEVAETFRVVGDRVAAEHGRVTDALEILEDAGHRQTQRIADDLAQTRTGLSADIAEIASGFKGQALRAAGENRKLRALLEGSQRRRETDLERLLRAFSDGRQASDDALQGLRAEFAAYRAETAERAESALASRAEATAVTAQLAAALARAQALEAELGALYRSTSWRITRPIRAVRTGVRKAAAAPRRVLRDRALALIGWFDRHPRCKAAALPLLRQVPPLDRRVRVLAGRYRAARPTLPNWAHRWHLEPDPYVTREWARLLRAGGKGKGG